MGRMFRCAFDMGRTGAMCSRPRFAPAQAAEKLRVAKVVPFAWSFTPLDIGIAAGIFAKHGLDIEASASAGDAKL